jgi:hypothetical protein
VCSHQIRLAIVRDLVSAHVRSPVECGSFRGSTAFLIIFKNLKECNDFLKVSP